MASCELVVPIFVSVPKKHKCLSGVDTNKSLDAVGALVMRVALNGVDIAPAAVGSHSTATLLKIKAINF